MSVFTWKPVESSKGTTTIGAPSARSRSTTSATNGSCTSTWAASTRSPGRAAASSARNRAITSCPAGERVPCEQAMKTRSVMRGVWQGRLRWADPVAAKGEDRVTVET